MKLQLDDPFQQPQPGGVNYGQPVYHKPAPKPKPKPKPSTVKPQAGGVNYGRPVYHAPQSPRSWKPSPSSASPNTDNLSITPRVRKVQVARARTSSASPNTGNLSTNPAVRKAQVARANPVSRPVSRPTRTPNRQVAARTAINNVATRSATAAPVVAATAAAPATQAATAAADTTPAPTTREVVIPDYTLDPTYVGQMAAYQKQLENAQTADTSAKNDYDVTYNQTLKNIGWDPASRQWSGNDPGTQYGSAYRSNLEDYTGRGLGYSTDYYNDIGNINNVFNRQVGQLGSQREMFRTAQDSALGDYTSQNALLRTQAATEAASRIAAGLGIDASLVPKGGGSRTVTVPITQTA